MHERRRDAEATIDMKLEVVVTPVLDVDHAKRFYIDWVGGSTSTTRPEMTPE
jgi:hypothetical protein